MNDHRIERITGRTQRVEAVLAIIRRKLGEMNGGPFDLTPPEQEMIRGILARVDECRPLRPPRYETPTSSLVRRETR
jgi:hypothetical protein